MIDVHCHLNFHAFNKDYDAVIKRAENQGVKTIINVGTKLDSSEKAVELSQKYKNLYAIIGVHPHHADKIQESGIAHSELGKDAWIKDLEGLAKKPKVVAIGEIGLDYFSYKSNAVVDPKLQKEVFIRQIELAHKLKLPLQIHNRQAGKDILDILMNHKSYLLNPPGMFHCMSGSLDFLRKVLNLGFYVGFDGNITYKGIAAGETTELGQLVKYAPLDRILVETDSPFLAPVPYRGNRNEPLYAIIVGENLARIKQVDFNVLEDNAVSNAKLLFKINN
ncbi:TatD family hydrolase [Patescibacteria group bacterium]|nr:TatD family hydrolase [Patescibacteria group bacterium]MCL5010060.1 TatD family hydrolase [Patescibacteria group bacterium]